MFRTLVSAAAIFTLLFATLVSPLTTQARYCPDEPPSTLLSLHRKSEAIYVAKFEKRTDGDVVQTSEDSTTIRVSDHFSISSTLKGENQKFFVRTYDDYRYTGAQSEEIEMEEGIDDSEMPKPGDTVLLFLSRNTESEEGGEAEAAKDSKEGPGLDVVHYRDGIRKVKDGDLGVYESRLKELNGIFSSKKPSDSAIAAWLIKCIEEPATRWDGAFDLMEGFEAIKWKEAREDEKKQKAESGEASEEDEIEYREDPNELDRAAFAKALTDAQKNLLLGIAIDNLSPADTEKKTAELSNGDSILLEVVKNWGDARLARAGIDRLQNSSDDVWVKTTLMSLVAGLFEDKELSEIAEEFGTIAYQNADAAMGSDEEADAETAGTVEEPADEDVPETEDVPKTEPETDDAETAADQDKKPKVKTFGEARDELAAKFIARAAIVLAQDAESKAAK